MFIVLPYISYHHLPTHDLNQLSCIYLTLSCIQYGYLILTSTAFQLGQRKRLLGSGLTDIKRHTTSFSRGFQIFFVFRSLSQRVQHVLYNELSKSSFFATRGNSSLASGVGISEGNH